MARSTWVAHAFEWEKLLKCHLKGKASNKLANGQNIDCSEKRKRPKGFICPCTGVKYHNIQTCLLVYAADSGERLQDHWSSGFIMCRVPCLALKQADNILYASTHTHTHTRARARTRSHARTHAKSVDDFMSQWLSQSLRKITCR